METKRIPPFGALSSDIECRATRFVTAGCLPKPTLSYFPAADKSAISTARRSRLLWKTPFSTSLLRSHYRATQGCDPSAESSPEWMAAFGPPPGQPASPSKDGRFFVQPIGSTSTRTVKFPVLECLSITGCFFMAGWAHLPLPLSIWVRTQKILSETNTVITSHLERPRLHKPGSFFTEPEGVLKMRARTPVSSTIPGLMTDRRLNWSGQDRPNPCLQGLAIKRLWQEWQVGILADDFVHVCP